VTPTADLRSDTLTRPTDAMRRAMADALVGDDVYGEDPTVLALEREVAELVGQQAGLFTPTGSMANQLGVRSHVGPGEELIGDDLAHVLRAEMGASAVLSGITSRTWQARRGLLDPDQPLAMMAVDAGPYQVATRCVVVENTHNFGGGTVQPLESMQRLRDRTRAAGVAVHLDGARLWNAHVATGVALSDYGACADTVSVCLSKGLGAPVGSLLLGSAETIAQARIWRKRFGGGMRQVGILAEAGRYAVEHHLRRLADDHARALRVARAVAAEHDQVVDPESVHTNILVMDVAAGGWSAADFAAAATERGVLGYATDPAHVRYVWHLDVTDEQTEHAAGVLVDLVRAGPTG
jgi:threonine aldolase